MTVTTASASAPAEAAPRVSARTRALAPALGLAGLVLVSAVVRTVAAWGSPNPIIFPDEYIYGALGQAFAHGHGPAIRGHASHFWALLAPLVAAPAWLLHDAVAAYRAVQALNAVCMSLAAVPVYLLGRRLRLSAAFSLGAAALALALTELVYAANVLAEPLAYPLALAAVLAGVVALERPSLRGQLLFLALALLATLARLQFVFLAPAFAVSAAAIGVRERRLRAAVREQLLPVALCVLGLLVLVVAGLGYYAGALDLGKPLARIQYAGANLFVLAAAAGFTIVPGALLGLGHALARPRDRRELVFGALTTTVLLCVVAEAALYGKQVHERYTFYVVPLLALAFGLYARRGWPLRLWHAVLGVGLLVLFGLEPLSELGQRGETNSTFLVAVHALRPHVGTPGAASLAVLLAFTAGMLALIALSRWTRPATVFAVVFAVGIGVAASALTVRFEQRNARTAQSDFFASQPRTWVDDRGSAPATLLEAYGGRRLDAMSQLFWNRSVRHVALLPGAEKIDAFDQARLRIAPDGTLSSAGAPLGSRLLVDGYETYVGLTGATRVASAHYYDLYRVDGPVRLALYVPGRYRDGWMAPLSAAEVWSRRGGTIRFTVTLPPGGGVQTLRAKVPGLGRLAFRLRSGVPTPVTLPVCRGGHQEIKLYFSSRGFEGGRLVSAQTSVPRFAPGAAVCR